MRLCVTICFSKLLWLVIPRACRSPHNVHQHTPSPSLPPSLPPSLSLSLSGNEIWKNFVNFDVKDRTDPSKLYKKESFKLKPKPKPIYPDDDYKT